MTTDSRFKRLKRLGAGGMGEVWKAYDRETGAVVAVKTLQANLARGKDRHRFLREIEHLRTIRHPNVVRIVSALEDDEVSYAMEYCPGGDLDTWLETDRSDKEKMSCIGQICAGVDSLHSQKHRIIHRDLKPGNVLVGADGLFKISDLGLSLALEGDELRVTTSNWVSPGFSPPEQHIAMAEVEEAGDVFSIAAILYYMLTGRNCQQTPDLSDARIPVLIRPVLKWMLNPDPTKRLRDVTVCAELLRDPPPGGYDGQLSACLKCGGAAYSDCVPGAGWSVSCYLCGFAAHDGND